MHPKPSLLVSVSQGFVFSAGETGSTSFGCLSGAFETGWCLCSLDLLYFGFQLLFVFSFQGY